MSSNHSTPEQQLDVTLISTADWDNPYWTNKQHMAVQFAKRGHKVLYVESQGLRTPTATARDLKRIFRRLLKGLRPPKKARDNLWIWSPLAIPFHGVAAVRVLNRILLQTGLRVWQRWLGLSRDIMWTYSPMTTALYDVDSYGALVYHAVDDIKAQPGMPREAIAIAEEHLSRRADVIFVTALNLLSAHIQHNPNTHYFSNVADFDHFNRALNEETVVPQDLLNIPGPRIGFVGAISSYKLDFPLIRALADAHPEWSLVFVGEVGEGDPNTDSGLLTSANNIYLLGGRPYSSLPAYLKGMDVVLQPNHVNEYTRSMFPMKFFEYLAAGRSVVSTPLPALAEYGDVACFVSGAQEFGVAISRILAGEAPPLDARLNAARSQTYDSRTDRMLATLDPTLLQRKSRSLQPA